MGFVPPFLVLENIQVEICKILLKGDDRPTQVNALWYLNYISDKCRDFIGFNV